MRTCPKYPKITMTLFRLWDRIRTSLILLWTICWNPIMILRATETAAGTMRILVPGGRVGTSDSATATALRQSAVTHRCSPPTNRTSWVQPWWASGHPMGILGWWDPMGDPMGYVQWCYLAFEDSAHGMLESEPDQDHLGIWSCAHLKNVKGKITMFNRQIIYWFLNGPLFNSCV